jgi:hypothetical protein
MGKIGMGEYVGKLEENGIDSYDILKGTPIMMQRLNRQNSRR